MKLRALMVLAAVCLTGVVTADDLDNEIRQRDANNIVRTYSQIRNGREFVYNVTPAQGRILARFSGNQTNLNAEQRNQLEDTLTAIRATTPRSDTVVPTSEETATAACRRYYGGYYGGAVYYGGYGYVGGAYYGGYRYGGYGYGYGYARPYYGGGFYYANNCYNNVMPYYGSYGCGGYGYVDSYWY